MPSEQERTLTRAPETLEQRAEGTSPIPKRAERTFTVEEFQELIAYASSLQEYAHQREDKTRLEAITKELSPDEKEGISASAFYRIGEEVGISPEYLQRAVEMRYPSAETQRRDIESLGAVPTRGIAITKLLRGYETVMEALQAAYPERKFENWKQYWDHWEIDEIIPKKSFLGIKRRKNLKLAEIRFYSKIVEVDVYHPLFLRACGETIKRLNEELEVKSNIKYHYLVE